MAEAMIYSAPEHRGPRQGGRPSMSRTADAPQTDEQISANIGWLAWASARMVGWSAARPWALPTLAAVLGIALRLWLTLRTHAMIDGDEAMVGIQAERI